MSIVIYEAYVPVMNNGASVPTPLFRYAFDELTEKLGLVETWPVYRQLDQTGTEISEQEFYRYQVQVADTYENRHWLLQWRKTQEQHFRCPIWMIRYRSP